MFVKDAGTAFINVDLAVFFDQLYFDIYVAKVWLGYGDEPGSRAVVS